MAATSKVARRALVPTIAVLATAAAVLALVADASAQGIRVAGIGASQGNQAADEVFASGDLVGSITRISESQFNALSPAELRASYDVLLFTWDSSPTLDADWTTRLLPYLMLGGGILWEDPSNVSDLYPAVIGENVEGAGDVVVSAAVPGLTDGIASDPGGFANRHIRFLSWTGLSPFLTASGDTVGLYGIFAGGGRIVLTGPDQDYHSDRGTNQYDFLVNELRWAAPSCTSDAECPAFGCFEAGTCNLETGRCEHTPVPDGTACDDDNACTQVDACVSGVCTGGDPVICSALDQCHLAGTCSPATGVCSNPLRPNGSACDAGDGTACTQPDTCQAGVCRAGGGGDFDGDGVCAVDDDCPADYDPQQRDLDGDGPGDVCDARDGALNVTQVRIRRSTTIGSGGSNGAIVVKGDFLTAPDAPALDVFGADEGVALSIVDALSLDVSTAPAAFAPGDCAVKRNGMIRCQSADKRSVARFTPLRTAPSLWRFFVRLLRVEAVPPFEGPVDVALTYGEGVDRTGRVGACQRSASGMRCTHPMAGSVSAAFLDLPKSLVDF